jgi:hypothetical protein
MIEKDGVIYSSQFPNVILWSPKYWQLFWAKQEDRLLREFLIRVSQEK